MSTARKLLILGFFCLFMPQGLQGQTPDPVVHAVLFYSPTCPHCHQVINEQLIPLQERYGNRLVILGMDTSQQWANALYWDAIRHFELPEEDWVVPILIVGEEVLIGGFRIANRFPGLIEEGLAANGIDLPDHPALLNFLQEQGALDPRYPDRRIARQGPAPTGDEAEAGADSVPARGEPSPGDSMVAQDSVTVVDSMVAQESVAIVDSVVAQDSAAVMDSTGGAVPSLAVDSVVGGEEQPSVPDTVESAPAEDASEREEAGPVPEAQAEAEGEAPGEPRAQGDLGPQETDAGDLGTLGIQQAARELDAMTMGDRFQMDPGGNTLAVLVLLGMILSLGLRGYPPRVKGEPWPGWVVPVLVIIGASVASYLSWIEVTQTEAVCGPVGDCNTVNQSEYARLFGILPVGVLGLVGYGVILLCWVWSQSGAGETSRKATLGLWAAALAGTLFSVYLTFLEPFVIGATCVWCLTSAVVMTLLLWASSNMAAEVWAPGQPPPVSS